MKKIFFILSIVILLVVLFGCGLTPNQDEKMDTLDSLLVETNISREDLEIEVRNHSVVPDTLKSEMAQWITATISAASLHMTGGDYEDPEDVIDQAEETAQAVFSRERKQILLSFHYENENKNNQHYILYEDLTPTQKKIFNYLMNK